MKVILLVEMIHVNVETFWFYNKQTHIAAFIISPEFSFSS